MFLLLFQRANCLLVINIASRLYYEPVTAVSNTQALLVWQDFIRTEGGVSQYFTHQKSFCLLEFSLICPHREGPRFVDYTCRSWLLHINDRAPLSSSQFGPQHLWFSRSPPKKCHSIPQLIRLTSRQWDGDATLQGRAGHHTGRETHHGRKPIKKRETQMKQEKQEDRG